MSDLLKIARAVDAAGVQDATIPAAVTTHRARKKEKA